MDDYPTYPNLIRCFESCPGAIFTYVLIWKNAVSEELFIHKEDVRSDYLTDLNIFTQELCDLREAKLLEFNEDSQSFYITLPIDHTPGEGRILC
jgi:hypothetical protein